MHKKSFHSRLKRLADEVNEFDGGQIKADELRQLVKEMEASNTEQTAKTLKVAERIVLMAAGAVALVNRLAEIFSGVCGS